jgi:hypothetical protein
LELDGCCLWWRASNWPLTKVQFGYLRIHGQPGGKSMARGRELACTLGEQGSEATGVSAVSQRLRPKSVRPLKAKADS